MKFKGHYIYKNNHFIESMTGRIKFYWLLPFFFFLTNVGDVLTSHNRDSLMLPTDQWLHLQSLSGILEIKILVLVQI